MTRKKLLIILMVLIIPPIPILGVISQHTGNRIISGNSHAKFIDHNEAQATYNDAINALRSGSGSGISSGKPHYYFTFNVNLLPSGTKEGFVWEYKPGFIEDSFAAAANPSKYSADIEANLAKLGWTIQGGKGIQPLITKATNDREQDVARLQAAALACDDKKYCLEYKNQQLNEINDKPLVVRFYLKNKPYTLYLKYELYPLDETAMLETRIQYGCQEPSDEYCRK